MKVFTSTSFKGHWPVGVSAIIVARNKARALELLNYALEAAGLQQDNVLTAKDLDEVKTDVESCEILQDGNY